MRRDRAFNTLSATLLALAGCDAPDPAGNATRPIEEELADANATDPLIASIVQDPLMTDLQLTSRSNAGAIRPPDQPYTAMIPAADMGPVDSATPTPATAPVQDGGDCAACRTARAAATLTEFAESDGDPRMRACAPRAGYTAAWSLELPGDLPLPAAARVIEAAGANGSDCRLRAVTFAAAVPATSILDWYAGRATRAGYTTTRQDGGGEHVLAGRRARDGAAYRLYVRDAGRGVTASFVTNTAG